MSKVVELAKALVTRLEEMPGVHESHYAELKAFLNDESNTATAEEIEEARAVFGGDDVVIDEGALVSRADEGVWVSGWLYLSDTGG